MRKRLHCVISGRVQAVLFRDFTKRIALKLGLTGFVRNLPDGSVEVVSEGEEDKLAELLEHLEKGPLFAKVSGVSAKWREPTGEFAGFKILYSGLIDRF